MKEDLPILVSFSGGRTSAFMGKFLKEHCDYQDRDLIFVYANTGKEFPETLDFIKECDERFGFNTVWVEALVNPEKRKGTTFKIVTYETASRDGQPFEDVIAKYGVPNKQYPHCTRELKQMPIKKYMQSLGYKDWITAVGIRHDEQHRLNRGSDTNFINPFFPLADLLKVDESFIRNWWERQDFDLSIKDYQSNCDLCWKKSRRKRLTLINEDVKITDWWMKMEHKYGDGYIFDQRDGNTIEDQIRMSQNPFKKAVDQHELSKINRPLFEPEWDLEWDCMCKAT